LVLAFEALFEGAGLAFGCGVSSGAFFFIITAKTQMQEVIEQKFILENNFSSTFYAIRRL
jgi:hypothetical protein